MTLPSSGAIALAGSAANSINNEFGYGTDLASYRNKTYTNAAATSFSVFPLSPNSISMPQGSGYSFYGARKIPSGNVTYSSGGNWTVQPYNTLTIYAAGAGGGGGGNFGYNTCYGAKQATSGSAGGTGTTATFGVNGNAYYTYGTGGTGGNGNSGGGSNGSAYPSLYGYISGGSGNGSGGSGAIGVRTVTNPVIGGSGPTTGGSAVPYSCGGGGGGGSGGSQTGPGFDGTGCFSYGNAGSGSGGSAGYVQLVWS